MAVVCEKLIGKSSLFLIFIDFYPSLNLTGNHCEG